MIIYNHITNLSKKMTLTWSKSDDAMLLKLRNEDKVSFDQMGEWLMASPKECRERWSRLMDDQLKFKTVRPWTKKEDDLLTQLNDKGLTHIELAAELGRTIKSIDARVFRLRQKNKKARVIHDQQEEAETTEDEEEDAASSSSSDVAIVDLVQQRPVVPSTMALYDKTVGQPYEERCKTIARYRGWLMEGVTNQFLPKTDQVDREVAKCDDLIRLLKE
jgi:hypothetical protein